MPPQATPLPNTLGDVVSRCQSLLAGNTSSVGLYQRPYLVPFIQQAYEDMASVIKLASGKNFEMNIQLLNVPIGQNSLYPYQSAQYKDPNTPNSPATLGPLFGLYDPLRLWAKTTGALPQYWTRCNGPIDNLPFVNPPGITPGSFSTTMFWTWLGNQLLVTPVASAIDIQVYGRFDPPPLQKDEDKLLLYPRMTAALAYSASALTAVERSNPQILQGYAVRGEAMVDNIVADIIKQTQRYPRRLAKMGGSNGNFWGWGCGSFSN
jgi:hypothetical protein